MKSERSDSDPIEIATDHRCLLGALTDQLATEAASGSRKEELAGRAGRALAGLARGTRFETCCLPVYLSLAPVRFDREIQLPIACATPARLDTRVLLWPVGARDGQHPHCDGWAAFMAVQGSLTASEERGSVSQPEREIALCIPDLLFPAEHVSHHVHNVGAQVGLTIHIFGT